MAWRGPSSQSSAQKLRRMLRTFVAEPLVVGRALPGEFLQRWRWRFGNEGQLRPDEAWEEHMHAMLGAPWPCPLSAELDEVMADINARLTERGLNTGRFTYGWYSDAETLLCRAVWCVTRHIKPEVVIETGVAHGVTSRIVLEALSRNDLGHLWSIDLPFPFDSRLHAETGVAVSDACRSRWTYLEGSSRQRLPQLTATAGQVQMFIHDSLHTARNTLFEMERIAAVMPPGGVMLVDDIGSHDGFPTFARRHPRYRTMVCPSADQVGIFGFAMNNPPET